ncbi:NAD-glutamate dehydrogenase domain-containing protein [Stutzerimonas balearica]|uniref:NAD-glutamate dehydrogenase domain-containing protein n=1 Tax=Stutzerimonas balearica TaxID=74829 RepID=UPI003D6D2ACD
MGRSSWTDYDSGKISAGGGVFERSAKRIELSDAIRSCLGITDEAGKQQAEDSNAIRHRPTPHGDSRYATR